MASSFTLPPPPPEPTTRAPHGDPGERIAGDTLADVWPCALDRILTCGREVPTQYGVTRELLDLVTVIRDPEGSLATDPGGWPSRLSAPYGRSESDTAVWDTVSLVDNDAVAHPLLGFSWADLEAYTVTFPPGTAVPEGASYGYGSRLAGGDPLVLANGDDWHEDGRYGWWAYFECLDCVRERGTGNFDVDWSDDALGLLQVGNLTCPHGHRLSPSDLRAVNAKTRSGYPPPPLARNQLEEIDHLLAAHPDTRAAWLTPWRAETDCGLEKDRPCMVGAWFRTTSRSEPAAQEPLDEGSGMAERQDPDTSARVGHDASTGKITTLHLTVIFRSHDYFGGYPRNLAAACFWLVSEAEKHGMSVGTLTCVSMSAHLYSRDFSDAQKIVEQYRPPTHYWDQRSNWHITVDANGLIAKALTPNGAEVTAVLKAVTPGALRKKIAESGLVTEIGGALWLGEEILRVWSSQ